MSTNIIRLRDKPTQEQIQRVREWKESQLSTPVCTANRSLLEDIARLVNKIDAAAFLNGARIPSKVDANTNTSSITNPLDRAFLHLYRDAEKIMMRALDEYPATQRLGRRGRDKSR